MLILIPSSLLDEDDEDEDEENEDDLDYFRADDDDQ